MKLNLFKDKESTEDIIKRTIEKTKIETRKECEKDTEIALQEQANKYELEKVELKAENYSLKLENKRLLDRYEINTKREQTIRKAEKLLKFYTSKIFEYSERDHLKRMEDFQEIAEIRNEVENLFSDKKDQVKQIDE